MGLNCSIGILQSFTAIEGSSQGLRPAGDLGVLSAKFGQILDACGDPRDALMIQRSPFPALGDGVGVGADLVRLQAGEVLAFAIEHAHVGAEEFVS